MKLSTEKLAELQAVELEIFKEFVRVCQALNVKYYLVAGTLLGAVRHGGFIPWDDDIDVGIPREDYERFLAEAQKLLPSNLFLQTYVTDRGYHQSYAKIRNSNTAFIELSVEDSPMNHGVFMDIFPLDKCNVKKRNSFMFRLKERLYLLSASSLMKNYKLTFKRKVFRMASKLVCANPHKALHRLNRLYSSMPDGNMMVNFSGVYGEREIMPVEWYANGTVLTFEGQEVVVPLEYAKVLGKMYGDYMTPPPPEKRVTMHKTSVIDTERSYNEYSKTK